MVHMYDKFKRLGRSKEEENEMATHDELRTTDLSYVCPLGKKKGRYPCIRKEGQVGSTATELNYAWWLGHTELANKPITCTE